MGQGCNTEINKKKEGEKDAKVKYGIDVRSVERKHMKKKKKMERLGGVRNTLK